MNAQQNPINDQATQRLAMAEALLQAIPDFVYMWDVRAKQYVHSNGNLAGFLGFTPAEVSGMTDGEFAASVAYPGEVQDHLNFMAEQQRLREGQELVRRLRLRTAREGFRWFQLHVSGFSFDENGFPIQLLGTLTNVHDLVDASFRAADSERRFRELFDRTPVGTALIDDEGIIVEANAALCNFLGGERHEIVGVAYDAFVHHDDRAEARVRREAMVSDGSELAPTHRRFVGLAGDVRWGNVGTTRILDAGRPISLVTFEDVTLQREATARLEHAATHDSLTGLPNRRLLSDRLDQALIKARREPATVAVFFLDLDLVKSVNDRFGHDAGDDLLSTVAQRILATVRAGDTVARIGGDEFVIVCEAIAAPDEITQLADRILQAVSAPIALRNHEIYVTASIGIATSRDGEASGEELVRAADIAMYEAKSSGRARYVLLAERDA